MAMGSWTRFKIWLKRTVKNIVVKTGRTQFVRNVRKGVQASAMPLAITGVGSLVGAGVAGATAISVGHAALIGGGIALVAVLGIKFYERKAAELRRRRLMKLNYTIWSKKEKSCAGLCYVVEASPSM